jgi:hypothetical protein
MFPVSRAAMIGRVIGSRDFGVVGPTRGMQIVIFKGMIQVGRAAATGRADRFPSGPDRSVGSATVPRGTDPGAAIDRDRCGLPPGSDAILMFYDDHRPVTIEGGA